MKIDCYYNLHKNCLSIRSREKENYGKVVDHVESVIVEGAKFIVQPAGANRTRKTGVKNVHAFVRGKSTNGSYNIPDNSKWEFVEYNPFKWKSFVRKTLNGYKKVTSANAVFVCGKKILALNPK